MAKRMSTQAASPPVEPDPVLAHYQAYEEDGKIRFTRHVHTFYGQRGARRVYTYYIANRQLWRTYVKTGTQMHHVGHYSGALSYIRVHDLEPEWPKHMRMDKGL